MKHLRVLRNKLMQHQFTLAETKTQIVCTGGGFTLPASGDWPAQQFGDADTIVPVLGADFSINSGFVAGLPKRVSKSLRAWGIHKLLLCEPSVPLKQRFSAATSVVQPSLFWGLLSNALHKSTLQRVESHALAVARLTAGLRRGEQQLADFNRDTAKELRRELGETELKWAQKLISLQGSLLGHCLRQPVHFPECSTLRWRNRE
eukprot:581430-Amphidinium_carterae.1